MRHELLAWILSAGALWTDGTGWASPALAGGSGPDESSLRAALAAARHAAAGGLPCGVTQLAYLKASNTDASDWFGEAVAISGDTAVIGARLEDSSATGVGGDQASNGSPSSGAAYVFVRDGATWTQQAYLKASNAEAGDWFGAAVAISGDTIVIGAPLERSSATGVNGNQSSNASADAGAAYVFVRSGTSWSQQAYLKSSNTDGSDIFGGAVAIWGETIVVGARGPHWPRRVRGRGRGCLCLRARRRDVEPGGAPRGFEQGTG